MLDCIDQMPAGDVILLHGCCHNPSGIDPTPDQWQQIASRVKARGLLPLVDFAYQGFADGLQQDALGLHAICQQADELLIASSYSKNFGLYRERIGGADGRRPRHILCSRNAQSPQGVYSKQLFQPTRPRAEIVQTILSDPGLREQWGIELKAMRDRINGMRDLFVKTMKKHAPDRDFEFIRTQRGMFSFSGLTKEQVNRLRDEDSIYIVGSGRINVAGITPGNIDVLCRAIAKVIS